jgi:hypothetical protein
MPESIARRERGHRQDDAEELRRAASTVHSASLREILIEIADEYEQRARRARAASRLPSGREGGG